MSGLVLGIKVVILWLDIRLVEEALTTGLVFTAVLRVSWPVFVLILLVVLISLLKICPSMLNYVLLRHYKRRKLNWYPQRSILVLERLLHHVT